MPALLSETWHGHLARDFRGMGENCQLWERACSRHDAPKVASKLAPTIIPQPAVPICGWKPQPLCPPVRTIRPIRNCPPWRTIHPPPSNASLRVEDRPAFCSTRSPASPNEVPSRARCSLVVPTSRPLRAPVLGERRNATVPRTRAANRRATRHTHRDWLRAPIFSSLVIAAEIVGSVKGASLPAVPT